MELIWTAFLLGLVGSLHCAVMCGPLMLAVGGVGNAGTVRRSFAVSRVIYHSGRITTYCLIGLFFGALGKSFAMAGMQRWLSIFAGTAILLGLILSTRVGLKVPISKLVVKMKSVFSHLLQRRTLASQFLLGSLNGFLPCGLVYAAAAGAATTTTISSGVLHMVAFGAGTLPMMLGIGIASGRVRSLSLRFQSLVPVAVVLVATLLLLRGMAFGIPYLSPSLAGPGHHACH